MVLDIGGGTTDIAVISLGNIVVSDSLKIAGDHFDESIIRYMRKTHNLFIGERTAEQVKVTIGTAFPRTEEIEMDVRGRNLVSGLPRTVKVSSSEILTALTESLDTIIDALHQVLEKTPPELAADVSERGIVLTGGGGLLYGLDKLIKHRTGIDVTIANDAVSCVAVGTGKYIDYIASGKGRDFERSIVRRKK
jgi:rod shape-determining protein MreB